MRKLVESHQIGILLGIMLFHEFIVLEKDDLTIEIFFLVH